MVKNSKRRSWKRTLMVALGVLFLVIIGAVWLVIWHVAPRAMVNPVRTNAGALPPAGVRASALQVGDGIQLAVWQAAPKGKPRAAIILLHGIADSKKCFAGSLRSWADQGILAIAPDLRGHGDSGGTASYGDWEKYDMSRLREEVTREHPGIPVGLWGTSYGGAVALQSAAADPLFSFVIVESTFSSLRKIACDQVSMHTHGSLAWLAPIALRRAGELGNFDFSRVEPARAAGMISMPVLHLHGEKDELISIEHAHLIRAASRGARYQFLSFAQGGHYNLRASDTATYDRVTQKFLKSVTR